jgi:hypothetical protein
MSEFDLPLVDNVSWLTSRCSQTGADASLTPAAERQTRWTDSKQQ